MVAVGGWDRIKAALVGAGNNSQDEVLEFGGGGQILNEGDEGWRVEVGHGKVAAKVKLVDLAGNQFPCESGLACGV